MNLPSGGIGRSEGQKIVGDLATTRKESKSEGIEEIKKNVVEELAASPKVDKKIGLKDFTHMFSSRTRNTGYEGGMRLTSTNTGMILFRILKIMFLKIRLKL